MFETNTAYCDYINSQLPASLNREGFSVCKARVFNAIGKSICIDFFADPRGLQEISHNNKFRVTYMLHGTPETGCSDFTFDYVFGFYNTLMAEMGIKRPVMRKQKCFKSAADSLINWFVKHEAVLLASAKGEL